MTQKRAQMDPEAVGAEFGDILDRMPGRRSQVDSRASQRQGRPIQPVARTERMAPAETKAIKVSLYLAPEDINALDAIIMQRRLEEGVSPRRTHLIREAIHQWLASQPA
ncbi:MAG: hypothetical protein KDD44_00995 [Bdellovibrionales bacterium]|nr:hypothetical protein [Bdellovibrionales bacterium]